MTIKQDAKIQNRIYQTESVRKTLFESTFFAHKNKILNLQICEHLNAQ